MKYIIRYNHTSADDATSLNAALRKVRREAGVRRLSRYNASDALYVWRSKADQDADIDGSRAYATIESATQRASHGFIESD